MKVTKFFLPRNLDLDSIRNLFRAEYVEKLFFFISTIHFRRVTNRGYGKTDFIPLKAKLLGQFIRMNDVRRVKNDLLKLGIIETDNLSIVGKKCEGFRLTEKYRSEKAIVVPAQFKKEVKFEEPEVLNGEAYLYDTLKRITIDSAALKTLEESFTDNVNSYNFGLVSYHLIRDQNWFWASDERTGRVFHNVANTPKQLRPFIRLDGNPLVECDISNSQPMLLYFVYQDKASGEAERYKEIVESGKFYEVIQAISGDDRETTKKRFMSFCFGRLEFENKVSKAFHLLFPELAGLMDSLKVKDYRAMAILLQKLEADLVIKTVVPICQMRGIPVLTIHDSLMTFPERIEEVRQIVSQECMRLYSVAPNVKISEGAPDMPVLSENAA